ncbi:hypothetical protein EW145_g701 [Phellinidium pouzarii]|uniref:DNA polymerase alpha subunit B n=1 Tax=Phellinidium pouzarii TaxID=167371 RepID=A0A4S4LHV7_9AGAM|nr:hypothetical protein EW145_g701 [Phellinidium pouzarii]
MSATEIRDQLTNELPELQGDEKLLSECIIICQNYNISGTYLYYKLEAKRFSSSNVARGAQMQPVTFALVQDVKKELIEELNRKRLKDQTTQQKRADLMNGMMRRAQQNVSRSTKVATGGISSRPGVAPPSVSFKGLADDKKVRRYRFMYEKVSERSEILDERIDEFGELIREHYNIDELGDPASTSEEDVVVVGRVCNDADAFPGPSKLTEGSVFIESSRMMGSGSRIPLRFSPNLKLRGTAEGAGGIGLFPGAIIAIKGKNGGGGLFVVDEILGFPPLALSPEPSRHKSFTMVVACGPYTLDTNLEYTHFSSFIERVISLRPSVLLLLGPFVDAFHPIIKAGHIDQTPGEIFRERFVESLRSFLKVSPDSLILLEPSIRDILSDHPVFPQCELDDSFMADPRVKMIPNPCRFSINDVTFATTSVDVLLHLRNQEYTQRGQEIDPVPPTSPDSSATDLLTNSCRHLLLQRSFYPLFPVPADLSSDVNLDVSHSAGLRLDQNAQEYAPDVLFLPSKFKQFTKVYRLSYASFHCKV